MPPAKRPRSASSSTKPAAAKTPAAVEPEAPAALDLDTLERENAPEPFVFIHNRKRYRMGDPKEIDWQKLIAAMSNPFMFLRLTLPEDQANDFITSPMPTWKMNALMERFLEHYGLPSLGDLGALPQ